jgi:F0F1-type ATP synthase assembly protein I
MEGSKKDNKPNGVNSFARYSGLFFQMFFIIGIFAIAGYTVDEHAGNNKMYYTAGLSLLGVIVAIYHVLKEVNQMNNQK